MSVRLCCVSVNRLCYILCIFYSILFMGGGRFFSRTRCVNLYFLWDEFAVTAQSSGFGLRAQTLSTLKPLTSSLCNGSSLCRTSGFYAALTRGRIKCCILSVCLSVRLVPPIFSKWESSRNFQFSGNIALARVTRWTNLRLEGQVQGRRERKFKVFRTYFRQKWIDLRQNQDQMINGPFYTYHQSLFISGNASFLW